MYLREISKYKPPGGAYIWRGNLTEVFLRYEFGFGLGLYLEGLIHGGAYFRNFNHVIFHLNYLFFIHEKLHKVRG